MEVAEGLKASGVEASRLGSPSPYMAGAAAMQHRHSWVEAGNFISTLPFHTYSLGPLHVKDPFSFFRVFIYLHIVIL